MTKQELTNLCKGWSKYLQQYSNEKYLVDENGIVMFQKMTLLMMEPLMQMLQK